MLSARHRNEVNFKLGRIRRCNATKKKNTIKEDGRMDLRIGLRTEMQTENE
jgi:hypothetical protein